MNGEDDEWERDVAQAWAATSARSEPETVAAITELSARRPPGDAAAFYEMASAYDFAGQEADAEPLYRSALAAGLDPVRRPRAVIQLASTLRNLGRASEGVTLLAEEIAAGHQDGLDDERKAFLALALLDGGRPDEAVAQALLALAPHLSEYRGAVSNYALDLLGPRG